MAMNPVRAGRLQRPSGPDVTEPHPSLKTGSHFSVAPDAMNKGLIPPCPSTGLWVIDPHRRPVPVTGADTFDPTEKTTPGGIDDSHAGTDARQV